MITEYPLEDRRYDQPEYEPFWAAAEALDLPLSLHTATRRQSRIRGAGDKTLRDASSRATKAFYPALSLCDLIFSGVFETQRRIPPQRRRRSASPSRRASSAASASSQSRKRPIFATFAVAFGQTIQ
jgi:hypothetical protein